MHSLVSLKQSPLQERVGVNNQKILSQGESGLKGIVLISVFGASQFYYFYEQTMH